MIHLTKNDVKAERGEEQQKAFDELTRRIQTRAMLGHFDHSAETKIHSDAGNPGVGALFVQRQEGTERVIVYARRVSVKGENKLFHDEGMRRSRKGDNKVSPVPLQKLFSRGFKPQFALLAREPEGFIRMFRAVESPSPIIWHDCGIQVGT